MVVDPIIIVGIILGILAIAIPVTILITQRKTRDWHKKMVKKVDTLSNTITTDENEIKYLEKIAYFDFVTKLYTVSKFSIEAKKLIEYEKDKRHSIIIFEIENMSKIILSYGLQEGDKVRCKIAEVLKKHFDGRALYGRVHEQLFGVFASHTQDQEVINMTKEITAACKNISKNFEIVLSFGIYRIQDDKKEITEMINLAELAKRTVKKNADINYAIYTQVLEDRLVNDEKMGAEMNYALEHHQFIMYLQPMVNLRTHEIIGGEALVRWNHPQKGILSPFAFLPLFEANNFIIKLDHYIWDDAFKTIRHWIDNNVKPIPIHVNISPIHFDHPGFVNTLNGFAAKYKVPKEYVVLEFPERAFSDTNDDMIKAMENLKESGFIMCIDNFGSYHSPINLLKNLPISIIKLDRNFIARSIDTDDGLTIVRYLNAMTKELDKSVIAEGVENVEQVKMLTEMGCDYAQGFFFSKPLPLREFDEYHKKLLSVEYTPKISYPTFKDMDKSMLP